MNSFKTSFNKVSLHVETTPPHFLTERDWEFHKAVCAEYKKQLKNIRAHRNHFKTLKANFDRRKYAPKTQQ